MVTETQQIIRNLENRAHPVHELAAIRGIKDTVSGLRTLNDMVSTGLVVTSNEQFGPDYRKMYRYNQMLTFRVNRV